MKNNLPFLKKIRKQLAVFPVVISASFLRKLTSIFKNKISFFQLNLIFIIFITSLGTLVLSTNSFALNRNTKNGRKLSLNFPQNILHVNVATSNNNSQTSNDLSPTPTSVLENTTSGNAPITPTPVPGISSATSTPTPTPTSIPIYPSLYHKFGGFSTATTSEVVDAASDGIQVALNYGGSPDPTSTLGKQLLSSNFKVIDSYVQNVLYYYECHKSKIIQNPTQAESSYCSSDVYPQLTSDNVVIASVSAHLQSVQNSPYIIGFWVLDDQALWDTPGYAVNILNQSRTLIHQTNPNWFTVCGFGGAMGANYTTGWTTSLAQNFTTQGCDMVGLYNYSSSQPNNIPLPNSDNFDWSMSHLLPQEFASLQAQGWNITKEPLVGIPQAWAGQRTDVKTVYEIIPSTQNMVTQAQSFCKAGATAIIWYAWADSTVPYFPWNTPVMAQGVQQGLAACNSWWGI